MRVAFGSDLFSLFEWCNRFPVARLHTAATLLVRATVCSSPVSVVSGHVNPELWLMRVRADAVIVSVKDVALLRPISCSTSTTTAVAESTTARYFFLPLQSIYTVTASRRTP